MLFSSTIWLLALSLSLRVLAAAEVDGVIPAAAAAAATAVAERGLISSIAILTACSTVSGLASPQPSGAVCDFAATSVDSKILISYTSGTYIESVAACGKICLATSGCTNLYFAQGTHCNLHYGPAADQANGNTAFRFYD
ncbi:MAG: hypothetical protein M1818_003466, partial [Claussenomyces sp. TS43310]